jgi:hypothetical protein
MIPTGSSVERKQIAYDLVNMLVVRTYRAILSFVFHSGG